MKNVLFIGTTNYDFKKASPDHLKEKFLGLSRKINVFVLARGRPFHKKIWGADFYLLREGFFYWPLAFWLAFYLCLFKKIDVLISQSPLIEGFVGTILKKIFRKKLIVEIHGDWLEGPFLSKKRRLEKLERKIVPFLAKFSLKRADKIRAISQWTLKKAREIAPHKPYFVFPTFTDIDIFLEGKETKFDNFILFVGGLEQVKGVDILIDAFRKIEKEFPEFKLIVIGYGSELKKLRFQVQPSGESASRPAGFKFQDKVEFKGHLSLEETKNIMKNCYCLVLPSRSEGLGRVLMEAMALGKPVIGSNIEGIPDLIKDGQNGFLFEKGDSGKLAEKLRILLNNKDLAKKMGQKGRKIVEQRFSNQKYINSYIRMINCQGMTNSQV